MRDAASKFNSNLSVIGPKLVKVLIITIMITVMMKTIDDIDVGAQSTLGGGHDIFAGKICMKN